MEMVNAVRKRGAIDSGPGGDDPAVREAVEAVYPSCCRWSPLHRGGHVGPARARAPVALAGWPAVDPGTGEAQT